MRLSISTLVTSLLFVGVESSPVKDLGPDADGKYTIEANGIKAQFVRPGASISNLFVKDKNGIERDVIVGFDTAAQYEADAGHWGSIPGRYANRIGDAQYTMKGKVYHTDANDGNNTLHSGNNGWGRRNWDVIAQTKDSITFGILDKSYSSNGMPGRVTGRVKYGVGEDGWWSIDMSAESLDTLTPLMLTQHTYFNLDAYANPETDLILNHTYHTPYSKRMLDIRGDGAPTGKILPIAPGSINDFYSKPKQLGAFSSSPEWVGNCGNGCGGYNNLWIVDKLGLPWSWMGDKPTFTLASDWSGIKVDAYTDQAGAVLYTCFWSDGSQKVKKTQGGERFVKSSGCVAIEAQDWSDGINHPEWKRKQFYGPGETFTWHGRYRFSTQK